jgi:SAM-dependent methyltransferase
MSSSSVNLEKDLSSDPFAGTEAYLEVRPKVGEREVGDLLQRISKFISVTPETRLLEVGIGTGWFPIACIRKGLCCEAVEINPRFIAHARAEANRQGVDLKVHEGSIEDFERPPSYDIIVASSVFEHVRDYKRGLRNVYRALTPGGVLYFYSTNRFALRSGEYPSVPFYGWLPDTLRYRLRVWRHGESIIRSCGVDFHQFTYWQLKHDFADLGFRQILDRLDYMAPADVMQPAWWKTAAIYGSKVAPIRALGRIFASGNTFICVK